MTASISYSATILADSPLAYYRLNEASGSTVTDASGHAHTGTTHNSPTQGVAGLLIDSPDTGNKAYSFNSASQQYISLPTGFTPTGASPWSLEGWIRMSVAPPASTFCTIAAFGLNGTAQSAQIKIKSGTPPVFYCSCYSADIFGGSLLLNTTYHVVGTYDGTSTCLYVNGALIAGPTAFALNVGNAYASIGADNTAVTEWFNGTIDEVAFYGACLSATQVANHYNAGKAITKRVGVRLRLRTQTTRSVGVRTRLGVRKVLTTGVRTLLRAPGKIVGARLRLATPPQVIATIAKNRVLFDERSFQLHFTADEAQRCQFTVLDYPGVASYQRGQQVMITDPVRGPLFSGIVVDDKQDKTNTFPDATIEHQIDTVGNEYFPGKRTSNRQYTTPTYAGKIMIDTVIDAMGAEGIIAPYATRTDSSMGDWSAGTLSSVVATNNVGDGDLELAPAGSGAVGQTYASSAAWNTGALGNVTANAGGDLSLTGAVRNWSNKSISGQTLYGNASPSQFVTAYNSPGTSSAPLFSLNCSGGIASAVARSRLDFAGLWGDCTISVDMLMDEDVSRHSLEYKTTVWNNIDSYAYVVEVTTGFIVLLVGTNGADQTKTTLAQTNFTQTLAHGWYHLVLVLSGTTHTVYLNGVQQIVVTDGTYTAPGYIGLRACNHNSSGVETFQFDNFAVFSALSGTWQSPSVALDAAGTLVSSVLTWNQSLSTGGTILIQTSIDGGATWQTASNGGGIPLLPPGTSGVGKTLLVLITLSTVVSSSAMPDISSLSWSISGGYALSGTRVSPTLALDPVGVIGSTAVSWTALLPSAATTLEVDTSIDGGVTWTNVTNSNGGPIPGLNTQPDPTIDSFAVNSAANYISSVGTGGTAATWVYDVANSRVIATGGASACYLYSALTVQNVDLLVDMDASDAGGIAWCFIDAGDYYAVSVADSQASVGAPNTISLYRVSSGSQSTVGTASITFLRGSYHRLRATNNGGLITITFDGTQVISYTDGSPLAAGTVGLYQSGSIVGGTQYGLRAFGPQLILGSTVGVTTTTRFYFFWIEPLGDNAIGKTVTTRCRLATTDSTVTPQVLDLTVMAYNPNIDAGALIPAVDNRQVLISAVYSDCAKQSNYMWYIDASKVLSFSHRAAMPAPWILQSSSMGMGVDLEADSNLVVEAVNDLYRNRQVLTGVIYTTTDVGNFQGDGQTTSFTLKYPVAPGTMPLIVLNGVGQKIGLKGTTGAQWYYAIGDAVIAQDTSFPVLTLSDRLNVPYTGSFTGPLSIDNVTAQQALAGVEGGTGIVEAVEDVSSRGMSLAAATIYAQQLLVRYCIAGRVLTFATYRDGLKIGMSLPVFVPEEGIFDIQMLILTMDVTMQTQPNGAILYQYVVSASELPSAGTWQKLLATGMSL